jgi:hypothetical protein
MSRCIEDGCNRDTQGSNRRCLHCQAARLAGEMADRLAEGDDA